jgi:hypothetical protein
MIGPAGDTGKCLIEVEVDGPAEIELYGDTGRIRSLSGSPATWRRFECYGPIPNHPTDFRFYGVDGRGRQQLVATPRGNRGVAVVRIDDPHGGREAYTFDVTWKGGTYGDYRDGAYRSEPGYYPGQGAYGESSDPNVVACREAVRHRASVDYGYRNIQFFDADSTYRERPRDHVTGTFEARRDDRTEQMQYSCSMNGGGSVRSVKIQPADEARPAPSDAAPSSGPSIVQQCQDAVAERLNRDGPADLKFHSADFDNEDGRMVGTATVHRGNANYDVNYSCLVDRRQGTIQSVDLTRR